jgi:LysR family cyn operon transcriptional activator
MLLRHVRYFLAVADHQNFTRAAESLHLSQPTLSQQIKQLETSVGAQLLDRSGRAVRLTDAGTAYAQHARRALSELEAAERAIRDVEDLASGHLRLALTPTFTPYLAGPLVGEFSTRHPGIALTVQQTTQDRIEQALLDDQIDLGIAFADAQSPQVTATPLLSERLTLLVGPGHPAASATAPDASVADYRLALLTEDFVTRQQIDRYLRERRIPPNVVLQSNSVTAIIETVRHSRNLATVLPDATARQHQTLTPVRVSPDLPKRTAALLTRADGHHSAASRAFAGLALHMANEQPDPPRRIPL